MSEFRILNIVSSLHKVLKLKNFLSKVVMETMTNESCNCDILDIGSLALTTKQPMIWKRFPFVTIMQSLEM